MSVSVNLLHPLIVAEVKGVDLPRPMDHTPQETR